MHSRKVTGAPVGDVSCVLVVLVVAGFAFGPDGPAFYVQFGSAWFRP